MTVILQSLNIFINCTTKDSLPYQPFELQLKDYCAEPVWCNHTQEMQRRIRAWQFPEEPDSYLGNMY
jgi:hypothetical protein